MNNINGATANEIGGSTPSIPGPYRSPEQTEAFPLKQSLYRGSGGAGNRGKGLRLLGGCCDGSADNSGTSLRIIVFCFVTLTLAVVIALAIQIYYGDYQIVPHGSVATDSHRCSVVGTEILKDGGNAVDAAIASTLCLGVENPHVTGLGGGGFMMVYSHRKRRVLDVIDFREVAPKSVSMKKNLPGSFVGVPGMLKGLSLAYNLYGKLPWKHIVMPAVKIARYGFHVPESLVSAKDRLENNGFNNELMNFVAQLEPGKNVTQPRLAETLEQIADKGPDVFYKGKLTDSILMAVRKAGGKMTAKDLATYQPIRRSVLETSFADFSILVPDLPSGGPALVASLKLISDLNSSLHGQEMSPKYVASLVNASEEICREALAGVWGDPDFPSNKSESNEDIINFLGNLTKAVGSHVAAVDLNDIYVSVVSGLNTWFGSQLLTDEGFVLNNALANFGLGMNAPQPGKRPLSLATPIIAVEKRRFCGRRLVLGSGETTMAMQLLSQLLVFGKNLTFGVEAPRFQVADGNNVYIEEYHVQTFGRDVQMYLNESGYQVHNLNKPYQSCNIVEKVGDELGSHSDSRGGGLSSRF